MANKTKSNPQKRVALTKGRGGWTRQTPNPIGSTQDVEASRRKFDAFKPGQTGIWVTANSPNRGNPLDANFPATPSP